MFRRGFPLFMLMTGVCLAPAPTYADAIVISVGPPVTLNSSNLTTAGTQADAWLLNETFTSIGVGVLQFTDEDSQPLANTIADRNSGSWFTKTVFNDTDVAWTSFELELQEILGTPSGHGDGLSFAQNLGLTFSSSAFSTLTQIITTRDYLNFSNGFVAPGESVTFTFAVSDNIPQSVFYLAQTPNREDLAVPEPATLTLLGTGLLLLARHLRRR